MRELMKPQYLIKLVYNSVNHSCNLLKNNIKDLLVLVLHISCDSSHPSQISFEFYLRFIDYYTEIFND